MQETVGYKAKKEMDEILYKDSGIYRNRQIRKATTITLKHAYQEIEVLWDEEVKYRPGFLVDGEYAKIPVLFSKINGMIDNKFDYWKEVRQLVTKNSILIKKPHIIKTKFFRNFLYKFINWFKKNKLDIVKFKKSWAYKKYYVLQNSVQEHLLEKLKFIIDNKIFKGTFVNGTEKIIISTFLNLPNDILKLIHQFDFTGKNPKLIYLNLENKIMPIEDAIILVLLHYVGFDILIYTPNGINCIDCYLNSELINEYDVGNYVDDIKIPKLYLNKIFF